jgi:hypothetical protein
LAAAFLCGLFLVNCYRAATQSIVHDEAYSWQLYLSKPITSIFTNFSAANHLVATFLSWISFHVAGSSVWGMRLPTLIAGASYFVTALRLCARVFPHSVLFLLSVCLLTLHPLVLDFLVAARGYGLGLAGLFYALFALSDYLATHRNWSLCKAALAICFAIGGNLTFSVPCLALIFVLLLVRLPSLYERRNSGEILAELIDVGIYLIAPIFLFSVVLYCVFPLHEAGRGNFYWGVRTWQESFANMLRVSFRHNGYLGDPSPLTLISKVWIGSMATVTVALQIVVAGLFCLEIGKLYRHRAQQSQIPWCLGAFFLSAGTILGSISALFIAHFVFGVLYPVDRLALYFLALFPLATLSGCARISSATPFGRGLSRVCLLIAAVVLVSFVAQFNTRFFYVWRYDADTVRILQTIAGRVSPGRGTVVRLGISWPLEPAVNFYRVVNGYSWMAPVDRRGPNGDYDYYILAPHIEEIFSLNDLATVSARQLDVAYRGPVSNTMLAIPTR